MRAALTVAAILALAASAHAEPLRLRGDALASAQSPVGLLVLGGDGGVAPGVSAEALVWMGSAEDHGDALVMAVIARRADRRAEVRLGRLIATAGALRPQHLDGVAGRARLPARFDVEAFGGVPVVPQLGVRAWDWLAGGRVGRRLGDWGGVGVAALERRSQGRLDVRELGFDLSAARGKQDVAVRAVLDAIDPTLADVDAVVTRRMGGLRVELAGQHRVASHLLPATSLFTVLGDVASDRVGAAVRWKAAPRLDLAADVGARAIDEEFAADAYCRAVLRLDDAGKGAITGELRRTGVVDGGWTGARLAVRVPRGAFTAALEGELVVPDVDRGRGTVWPWGLAALGWTQGAWDAAMAVEASSTPADRYRVDVLAQLGRRWEVP